MENQLIHIARQFIGNADITEIKPFGNGLINDTYRVKTKATDTPDFVLQRINHNVFKNVDILQDNIAKVTEHIKKKLLEAGITDVERRVVTPVNTLQGNGYYQTEEGTFWRMKLFIPNTQTLETVNSETAYEAGKAFGDFENSLIDLPYTLGETIPDFHNMTLRSQQLADAVKADVKGRVKEVTRMLELLEADMAEMCRAEALYAEGKLPKRICHCDTKVNNMLVDEQGHAVCIVDLDTVMPSFVFSDYGDFLRTGANFVAEDHPQIAEVGFNETIFKAFTEGFLEGTKAFLTPLERTMLPFAAALFPFMQCTRFLTDYLNGDTYYKTKYEGHNLVRANNQLALYQSVRKNEAMMKDFIGS